MRTDRTVSNNKPDIIILDNKQGTCMSIDAAIPGDRNVIKKEAEGILKYKDRIIETQRMWNVAASDTGSNRGHWNHFRITQTGDWNHVRITQTGDWNHFRITQYRERTTSGKYRKQRQWALHTYRGKCRCTYIIVSIAATGWKHNGG